MFVIMGHMQSWLNQISSIQGSFLKLTLLRTEMREKNRRQKRIYKRASKQKVTIGQVKYSQKHHYNIAERNGEVWDFSVSQKQQKTAGIRTAAWLWQTVRWHSRLRYCHKQESLDRVTPDMHIWAHEILPPTQDKGERKLLGGLSLSCCGFACKLSTGLVGFRGG